MLSIQWNHWSTFTNIFLKMSKLLSELIDSTAQDKHKMNLVIGRESSSSSELYLKTIGEQIKPRIEEICLFSSINVLFEQLRVVFQNLPENKLPNVLFCHPSPLKFKLNFWDRLTRWLSLHLGQALEVRIRQCLVKSRTCPLLIQNLQSQILYPKRD